MKNQKTWRELLGETALFADVDASLLELLIEELREQELVPGEYLVHQGDEQGSMYILVDGRFTVTLEDERGLSHELPELGPGSIVGEIALLLGGQRSASVRAVGEARVLELSQERFMLLADDHPELLTPFTAALRKRMRRIRVVGYLKELFGDIDPEALEELEQTLEWVDLANGRELFHQGDAADGAYIVVVGRLRVSVVDGSGDSRLVDVVGPGNWMGEMALLTQSPRSATVTAIRDTQLVRLSQEAFERVVAEHPTAMIQISRQLVARLQRLLEGAKAPTSSRVFAVVPIGPEVDTSGFCQRLRDALARHGQVAHLTSSFVDAALSKPGIANTPNDSPAHLRLSPWLTERETSHDYVVYEADARWTGWSATACRNVDEILLVADAKRDAGLGLNERRLIELFSRGQTPRCSLVLLQRRGLTTFPGTKRWLTRAHVGQHYHVIQGSRADTERLVRLLTGRAITLVLGGGGSRGYAHVGVLRTFEELGIPVDAICGTSIGAVIAGSHALGLRWRELLTVLQPIFNELIDLTLPLVSLASGRNAVRGTERVVGKLDIEDLRIPYFAVSTNLSRGHELIHDSGSLAFAARASGSLPGIFPPVPGAGGDLLVDGGLCNNVPVDVMCRLHPGAAIAIDVIPDVDLKAGDQPEMHLSGWRVAWRYVNPATTRVRTPDIINILMRAATAASFSMQRAGATAEQAALLLKPQVAQWNMLDFKDAPKIAEQGYRSTRAEIESWWREHRASLLGADPRPPRP